MNNLHKLFAYKFGYFGAISLYCSITGQITSGSPVIEITGAGNNAKGYITASIATFKETVTFYFSGDLILADSPLTRATVYCIYGVWYTG